MSKQVIIDPVQVRNCGLLLKDKLTRAGASAQGLMPPDRAVVDICKKYFETWWIKTEFYSPKYNTYSIASDLRKYIIINPDITEGAVILALHELGFVMKRDKKPNKYSLVVQYRTTDQRAIRFGYNK